MPAVKLEVAKVALDTPPLVESVVVPNVVLPSSNVTVPVGVKDPLGCTVAVKVMDCPATEGSLLEVSGAAVPACTF